jgi:hypothetical protein
MAGSEECFKRDESEETEAKGQIKEKVCICYEESQGSWRMVKPRNK